jgi:spermidine synthase
VIGWHQQEKVPLGQTLNVDPRCRYVHGSFFDLAVNEGSGFDPDQPGRLFDAILLDIDHSPRAFLNQSNASFYTVESLQRMARQLRPGGVFALWSNDPPDEDFMVTLNELFNDTASHVVAFYNPLQNCESTNTVYVGVKPAA